MSQHLEEKGKAKEEPKQDDDLQFSWGRRTGNVYYKSFTYDGTQYSLYDCVYMYHNDGEPSIGKLVKIWETPSHEKKVETVWFLRPSEISNWPQDVKPLEKEIFLACGQGKGVSNTSPLESISGKCIVVCVSEDKRNCLPTREEVKMADYMFCRTFDVGKRIISAEFPTTIGTTEVSHFFNVKKHGNPGGVSEQEEISRAKGGNDGQSAREDKGKLLNVSKYRKAGVVSGQEEISKAKGGNARLYPGPQRQTSSKAITDVQSIKEDKGFKEPAATKKMDNAVKVGSITGNKSKFSVNSSDCSPRKKLKLLSSLGPRDNALADTKAKGSENVKITGAKDSCRETQNFSTRLVLDERRNNVAEKDSGNRQHAGPKRNYEYSEVSRRPRDPAKWLKLQRSDEEGLHSAHENGTLVLLDNLDPSFTSEEVEDIIWHAFGQRVQAKMMQYTFFRSPYSGQALVLFKTKEAADDAIAQLTRGCLVLDSGRPIVGQRSSIKQSNPSGRFFGHLSIDGIRALRQRRDNRDAVSTSHPSQPNTLEYDLAMQWQLLQAKSEQWWTDLFEKHVKELQATEQLKDRHRG